MGRDDPLVPVINGQILARLIPGARLQIIEDGHLFFLTQPQQTAAILEHFLAEGRGTGSAGFLSPHLIWKADLDRSNG
jgi:hypothetical protein